MILPFSVTRCAGRPRGLGPDDPVCERRNSCERYLAMIGEDREVYPNGYPLSVRVASALCVDGADRFRPADGQGVGR